MPSLTQTRRLGRSDVQVTALGFGAGPIGNLFRSVEDEDAFAAIDAAWNAGIRYFDTAPHYGAGLSERRLGVALHSRPRASYVVSTKVGRVLVPRDGASHDHFVEGLDFERVWDFSADGVRRSLDDSLQRLGLDRVDIALIHDPDDHWDDAVGSAYPTLERLRAEGVVGAIGVGMNQTEMLLRFVRETDIDCVLVAGRYTLLDRSAEDGLLDACLERHVSVVAAGVFNSGVLADPDDASAAYDYAPASEEIRARARAVGDIVGRAGASLSAAALQFATRHPAVASVLVGCRTAGEVRDNVRNFARTLPPDLWTAVHAEPVQSR